MNIIYAIAHWLQQVSFYFNELYWNSANWPWPWQLTTNWWNQLRIFFYNLSGNFYQFADWVGYAENKLATILSTTAIRLDLQQWLDWADWAWDWVVNAVNNIVDTVNSWWSNTQLFVKSWIETARLWAETQVNNLATTFNPLLTWWNDFKSNIPTLNELISWFANWWANTLQHISTWWLDRLVDIKALFNSWTLDLAHFWEGWEEKREEVFDFFDSPLDWLEEKFIDWFLGV